ncbi:hypothetical protein [Dyella sp. 2HG41-7]|uniref:hypothetical protein n=1 Tax=Dyella sp. 2HG41-7 TaxID=2883239 RepID=UPI001F3F64B1|nr:hypothetical protein [Dyella sp. 2HG41-7]
MVSRWILASLLLCAGSALAAKSDTAVDAHGLADGNAPAWTINTSAPSGWTKDCCTYASAIGVNYVLYQGEWTGKPERVMVLNVWPSKLPSLDAELQDDRKQYLLRDPNGQVVTFAVNNRNMPCRGVLYAGTDHIDDAIVFCDPGNASGIRYSWSMSIAADDPSRQTLLDQFQQVAERSSYAHGAKAPGGSGKSR